MALYLPNMAVLVGTPPIEPMLMNQYDSKQWEHLLSQENDSSWSDLALLNLHSISFRSRSISATSCTSAELLKKAICAAVKPTSTKMDDLGL